MHLLNRWGAERHANAVKAKAHLCKPPTDQQVTGGLRAEQRAEQAAESPRRPRTRTDEPGASPANQETSFSKHHLRETSLESRDMKSQEHTSNEVVPRCQPRLLTAPETKQTVDSVDARKSGGCYFKAQENPEWKGKAGRDVRIQNCPFAVGMGECRHSLGRALGQRCNRLLINRLSSPKT